MLCETCGKVPAACKCKKKSWNQNPSRSFSNVDLSIGKADQMRASRKLLSEMNQDNRNHVHIRKQKHIEKNGLDPQ